jgi:hypothetical protein
MRAQAGLTELFISILYLKSPILEDTALSGTELKASEDRAL